MGIRGEPGSDMPRNYGVLHWKLSNFFLKKFIYYIEQGSKWNVKKSYTIFFNKKINMYINQYLHCKIKESDNTFCSVKEKYEILF